jgi:hypothetical protein
MFFLQSYFGVELQPDVEASAAISYAGTVTLACALTSSPSGAKDRSS